MKLFASTALGFVFIIVFIGIFFTIIRPTAEKADEVLVIQSTDMVIGTDSRLHFSEAGLL